MSDPTPESLKRELEAELETAAAERERFEAQIEDTAARSRASEATTASRADAAEPPALTVLREKTAPAATRVEVSRRLTTDLAGFDESVEALLAVVQDSGDDTDVRLAALQALGAAAFQIRRFGPHEQAYLQALRNLIGDPDARLREAAVAILAVQHDREVQQVLQAGLRDEGPLPVERERAIQLLAEDDHLPNLPWLQELYKSDSSDARQEAVRLMGSYPAATETLESVLRDKNEAAEVRQQSAASLRNLAPDRFGAAAKDIAGDDSDDPEVRSTSRHSLQHLGSGESVPDDAVPSGPEEVGTGEPPSSLLERARLLLKRVLAPKEPV